MFEDKRKVKIYDQDVILDTNNLHFSEETLGEYLEKEAGYIDYFGAKLAEAEKQFAEIEMEVEKQEGECERVYYKVFSNLKSEGGSDKFVESLAKVDPMVIDAENKVLDLKLKSVEMKYIMRSLQQHLKAWDRNHENCQNRGNTLRREMDRLGRDVFMEKKLEDVIKEVDV